MAANYNGSDSFTFVVKDGLLDSATATVVLTVNSLNDAPVFTTTLIVAAGATEGIAYTGQATDADAGSHHPQSHGGLPESEAAVSQYFSC